MIAIIGCECCAQLEEEVAYWKAEAGALADLEVLANLRRLYSLSPIEARFMGVLAGRRGRVIDADRLLEFAGCEGESEAILRAHVRNIRAKIGSGAIDTARGVGFSLGPAGAAAITAARAQTSAPLVLQA